MLFYSVIDRSNKLDTVEKEEKKEVKYFVITSELRNMISNFLKKHPYGDVHEIMDVLKSLAPVKVNTNELKQQELPLEKTTEKKEKASGS